MKQTRMYVRVDESELAEWKQAAASEGKLLSEWVRELCNGEAEGNSVSDDKDVPRGRDVCLASDKPGVDKSVAASESVRTKTKPACKHGTEKGYRCWQCGGIAKCE